MDFLRAASILVVVLGHWVMAAPYREDGAARIAHLLDVAPWTHWLTWLLQVMPVFFFVGGFSNAVSWNAARRAGTAYHEWLHARLARLLGPVLPLLALWVVMASVAKGQGVPDAMIRVGSQVALVPTWFLAVYALVALFVPLAAVLWRRLGYGSIALFVVLAIGADLAFFSGLRAVGWGNYLFVWLAVHQLGFAWQAGRLRGAWRGLALALMGVAALLVLTEIGGYPRSLVGVPSDAISNTTPPKIPLLALAALQVGLVLTIEAPARRWLDGRIAWTLTVLVNGMIMTIFLWHSTVMMLLFGAAFWLGGIGLEAMPATPTWWILRPIWIAVFALGSIPAIAAFARFEGAGPRRDAPSGARLVGGTVAFCLGLALLALDGVAGDGWFGLRPIPLASVIAGMLLAGLGPARRVSRE